MNRQKLLINIILCAFCFWGGMVAMWIYDSAQPEVEEQRECKNQYRRVIECP